MASPQGISTGCGNQHAGVFVMRRTEHLLNEAFQEALKDAGITAKDIDRVLLVGGGLYALRSVTGGQKSQGEACASSGDCARGHVCAGSVFRATQSVCRKTCDESTECPSGRCDPILASQRAGLGGISGFRGVCR